jgi:hypothetical protein
MAAARAMVALDSASRNRQPNEMGRIPILEYHLIGAKEGRWEREHTRFRRDLELLHERGYRPTTVAELGDRNIEGQKSAWRHAKLKFLAERGFELCNHTLWHAQLSKYDDGVVQEQIARLALAVDSAVPGYRVRTLALPLGVWPKNQALAAKGSWTDGRSQRRIAYDHTAVLLVAGQPVPSPFDPAFNPLKLERVQIVGNSLEHTLDWLEKPGRRYVSDGDARTVASPRVLAASAGADGRSPSAP